MLADTFPPDATINVRIMGDIISVNFAIFCIMFSVILYRENIWPDKSKIILNKHTKETTSLILSSKKELFNFCKMPHKSAIDIIPKNTGKKSLNEVKILLNKYWKILSKFNSNLPLTNSWTYVKKVLLLGILFSELK